MSESDPEFNENDQSIYANDTSAYLKITDRHERSAETNGNDQQVNYSSNQQVSTDDYQNIAYLDELNRNQSCDNLIKDQLNSTNSSNSSANKTPPPIKPRLSLLNKKAKEENRSSYELSYQQKLEKIDENLNLILQTHKDKFMHTDDILVCVNSLTVDDDEDDKDHYLSNDLLPCNSLLKNKRASELNRNTYISNSDVNEDAINNRISNTYNEIELDPIYTDIVFDKNKTDSSFYASLNNAKTDYRKINFDNKTENDEKVITPPPLPPRRKPNDNMPNNFKSAPKLLPKKHSSYDNQLDTLNNSLLQSNNSRQQSDNLNAPLLMSRILNLKSMDELRDNMHLFKEENIKKLYDQEAASREKLSSLNNSNQYGRINKIEQSQNDDISDDEGSLQSSYSLMNSQLNSSSNDSFFYKSARSNKSFNSNHVKNKPSIGVVSPFRHSSTNSSSTDLDNNKSQKSLVSLPDEQNSCSINQSNVPKKIYEYYRNPGSKDLIYNPVSHRKEKPKSASGKFTERNIFEINPFGIKKNVEYFYGVYPQFCKKDKETDFLNLYRKYEDAQKALEFKLYPDTPDYYYYPDTGKLRKFEGPLQWHYHDLDINPFDTKRQNLPPVKSTGQLSNNSNDESNQKSIGPSDDYNGQFSSDNRNNFKDFLYKTGYNRKHFQRRWCVLSDSALFYYYPDLQIDKLNINDLKNQKARGHIVLNDVVFINSLPEVVNITANRLQQVIKSVKKVPVIELHQFNLGTITGNGRLYLFAADSHNKRKSWIDLLAYKIRPKLRPSKISYEDVDACGYLSIKIGVTGIWGRCYCVMGKRKLQILVMDMQEENLIKIDLRQVMTMGYCTKLEETCKPANDNGQVIYLNRRYETLLYFQADSKSHTEAWFNAIENNWKLPDNGLFEDQLLSPSGIPIAVEKCINFISGYDGRNSVGIYKSSGDDAYTKCIVENLKSNSKIFDYHLRPEDGYTVYDVSDALKIYLHSFPDCILTENLYQDFLKLSFIQGINLRLSKLKLLLKRLPDVNLNALKKLICHFIVIIENAEVNKMNLENLASALAPYLIFSKISASPPSNSDVNLFKDLIHHYIYLFDVDTSVLDKERKIENSVNKLRNLKIETEKATIKIPIFLFSTDWGECLNIEVSNQTNADNLLYDVCKIKNLKDESGNLCACEFVANRQLERVLHYSEKIKKIALDWAQKWSSEDAKQNCILIKASSLYKDLEIDLPDTETNGISVTMLTLFNEVRFSEEGKSFKKVFLEFANSKFNVYKDAKATKSLLNWSLDDIVVYVGCEKKRNAPSAFCLTLIDKDQNVERQREMIVSKVISFNTIEQLRKWLAVIMSHQYPQGFQPLIRNLTSS